jgi:hypothetical protein
MELEPPPARIRLILRQMEFVLQLMETLELERIGTKRQPFDAVFPQMVDCWPLPGGLDRRPISAHSATDRRHGRQGEGSGVEQAQGE